MFEYTQEFKVFRSEIKPSVSMNYLLCRPADFKVGERLPMIVFLHGAGERGTDRSLIKVHGIPKMVDKGLPVRAIILAPQVPDNQHVWNTLADETAELIKKAADENNADEDRISITGISMGGYGTWEIAMSYDSIFSAVAPICGGGMSWRAGALKNIPVRAYHGDADDTVPVAVTLEMVDRINSCGGKAECIILHKVGHNSWEWAYEHSDLITWLTLQNRKKLNI